MVQTLRCQILFAFVVVMCAMAQSKEALEFSPVKSFETTLCKIAAEDFASEKQLRNYAIQRQIKSLLQSPAELKSLCSALHKELSPFISNLPLGKGRHQLQVKLWHNSMYFEYERFLVFGGTVSKLSRT